jgi:hypothetical protein
MNVVEPSMSDEAVKSKTGKDWAEWFSVLDAAGAQDMSHKEIVAYLVEHYQVGPWWQQMVTVTYEQARGLRQNTRCRRVTRSALEDVSPPVEVVFDAWYTEDRRAAWLPIRDHHPQG